MRRSRRRQHPPGSPGLAAKDKGPRKTVGIIQPSVISMGGKHLRLYARSQTLASKIAVADSYDDGVTWTQARFIDLPNNNSGIDAVALKDGRIVLVFNDTTRGRSPLNLAVSSDGDALPHLRYARRCGGRVFVSGDDSGLAWRSRDHVHVEPEDDQVCSSAVGGGSEGVTRTM